MAAEPTTLVPDDLRESLKRVRSLLDRLIELADRIEGPHHSAETPPPPARVAPPPSSAADARTLRRTLEEPFLLVIVGEVKSGKSTFINVLIGAEVCAVGPTPLTDRIHVLRFGETEQELTPEPYLVERRLAAPLLREACIVDTPGTNSILKEHGQITERFVPRADLVLFLTSIDRPYSESENQFLATIADRWRKNVVFVVTKIDGREPADVEAVVEYVQRSCEEHHGFRAPTFPISARMAQRGENGGFEALRRFVRGRLAERERATQKLRSPLRSSLHVLERLESAVVERASTLDRDHARVEQLDRELQEALVQVGERSHRFSTPLAEVFAQCRSRGLRFYERELRLSRIGLLHSSDRLEASFQKDVVADLEPRFDRVLGEAIDWLIQEELRLYERCTEALGEHLRGREGLGAESRPMLPGNAGPFEYRREEMVQSLQSSWRQHVENLALEEESRRVLAEVKKGLRNQIGLTLAAVGVGAGTIALTASLWASLAGIGAAVLVGGVGLAILPSLRRKTARRFSEKMDELSAEATRSFHATIAAELSRSCDRMSQTWEPFVAFHRAETRLLDQLESELAAIRDGVQDLDRILGGSSKSHEI